MLYSYEELPIGFGFLARGCRIYLVSTFFRLWLQSISYQKNKKILVQFYPVFKSLAATQYISMFKYKRAICLSFFYCLYLSFFFSILNIYTCKHKIYNHQLYIYLICLGMKKQNKTKKKNNNKNKNKN